MAKTAAKVTGITDKQLKRLRDGGWVDDRDNKSIPSWTRWVGDARTDDTEEAQGIWAPWLRTFWSACPGPEAPDVVPQRCDDFDLALDLCDQWKDDLEIAKVPGDCTNQAKRFKRF